MIEPALLLGFMVTALIIELTPGPNMAWLIMLSLSEGRRAGYMASGGIALGLLLISGLAALGLAALISASPLLYEGLRWTGALFLLYLAVEGWLSAGKTAPAMAARQNWQHGLRGFVINVLNPKAAFFYVTVLPQFIATGRDERTQALILALTSVAIATIIHLLLVTLAASLRGFIENERQNRLVRRILAVGLAIVAVWLLISTAR
ncbi:MAG: LysE family translocator [Alphaproteobacteria bacterium]|nr:LysE family translocator [Alphaproteobacteria bacterium]